MTTATKYKAYPKYKPSGVDWLGDIPTEWETKKVRHLVNNSKYYQVGDGDHGSITPEMYQHEGIPYLRVQNLSWDGHVNSEGLVYISQEVQNANLKSKLIPDDILIAKTGATIGKVAQVPQDVKEANTTSSVGKITVDKQKYSPRYVLYSLISKTFQDQIWIDAAMKSAQPGFNVDDLITYIISCPSLSQQNIIAAFLDRETAKIDEMVAKKQKLIDLLKEGRKALITNAVTKGLDPKVEMKPSGIAWLGDIPEGWEIKRAKYLGRAIIGLTYSPDEVVNEGDGVLILRSSNIQNGLIEFSDNVYVKTEIPEKLFTRIGDILICSRNGSIRLIGKNVLIDESAANLSFGAFMTVFRSKHYEFLYYFFNSSLFISQTGLFSTSTINQLTTSILDNLEVPTPPADVQQKIVAYLKRETVRIDSMVKKVECQIEKLQEYRQALITNAVTGKIMVS